MHIQPFTALTPDAVPDAFIHGWNDYEQPLVNADDNALDADVTDELLAPRLRPEQRKP